MARFERHPAFHKQLSADDPFFLLRLAAKKKKNCETETSKALISLPYYFPPLPCNKPFPHPSNIPPPPSHHIPKPLGSYSHFFFILIAYFSISSFNRGDARKERRFFYLFVFHRFRLPAHTQTKKSTPPSTHTTTLHAPFLDALGERLTPYNKSCLAITEVAPAVVTAAAAVTVVTAATVAATVVIATVTAVVALAEGEYPVLAMHDTHLMNISLTY